MFKRGFSLIEALIAISVLAVGIVALLEAFPLGAHLQNSAQMTNVGVQLAQAKMEELNSLSYGDLSIGTITEDYGFDSDFPTFKRETVIDLFDPNNTSTPPGSDLGIKKIEISVFWHNPFGVTEKELKIANLITEK